MRNFIRTALIGSGLLLLGTGVNAQVPADRDQYYEQTPQNSNVVDQVRADLNQAMNSGYMAGWQRNVLAQASNDLAVFDRQMDRGSFNRRELDEAIARIQNVANSARLSAEQRAMLQDDIGRLRDFRASQTTYSYRNNPYYGQNGNGYYRSNGYYDRYGNWHPYR